MEGQNDAHSYLVFCNFHSKKGHVTVFLFNPAGSMFGVYVVGSTYGSPQLQVLITDFPCTHKINMDGS